jgi:membrane protein DedA with SNARE-associated domain
LEILMFPVDAQVIAFGGYGAVAIGVAIESIGVPFPGETTLIAAAIYAGASHRMSIVLVVLAATAGAVCGGSIGFWAGRQFGLPLLSRFGCFVGITPKRIKLGRYLFLLHGGKLVFFGRFLTFVRTIIAFLAGTGQMTWSRFSVCNSAGAIVWATVYGGGAFYLGRHVELILGPTTIAGAFIIVALMAGAVVALRQHETRLIARAEAVLLDVDNLGTGS